MHKSWLPNDMHYEIICYLIDQSDITRIMNYRLVCKTWKNYIDNNLSTFYSHYSIKYLQLFPNIKKMILSGCENTKILDFHLPKLEEIIFDDIDYIFHFDIPSVKKITIKLNNDKKYVCLEKIIQMLISKKIEYYTLINKKGVCVSCLDYYEQLIHLKEIKLIDYDELFPGMIQRLVNLPKLEKITLINCNFYKITESFPDKFNYSPTLKSVVISKDLNNLIMIRSFGDLLKVI